MSTRGAALPECRVAVVGSGAAGLMAAIEAAAASDCVLITDGPLGQSNSAMAQGGLQYPPPGAEALARFADDMRRSAREALDPERVHAFLAHVRETVETLAGWGLALDRDAHGDIVRRLAGGLSEARIVSVRDQIGPAIIKVLRRRLGDCRLTVLEHTRAVDLTPGARGVTLVLEGRGGARTTLRARAVVCATGGITYREAHRRRHPTTNPPNENHVLFDRLVALGLPLIHAEYFQFQPYGIVDTAREAVGRCVPESIVNLPVRLLDRERRPIGDVRQDRYELTRLLFAVAEAGRAVTLADGRRGVWLTLSDIDPAVLAAQFPKVQQYLERSGTVGQDVLVFPFLHYYLGGFRVGADCATAHPGLYLAGEMIGGLHGRNRLMGNGITDSLVHGAIAGRSARAYAA